MKQTILILILLSFASTNMAQQKPYFGIKKEYSNGYLELEAKKSKKATQNINQYIQLALFENLITNLNDSLLQEKWQPTIHINNKNILSLTFQNKQNYNSKNFVFNSATGSLIDITDFINVNGITKIKKGMVKQQSAAVVKEKLPFIINEKVLKTDINNYCLNNDSIWVYSTNYFELDSAGNASNYSASSSFSSNELAKYLNIYGQAMFGVDRKLKMRKMYSTSTSGLYKEAKGKSGFIIQLNAPYQKTISGVIYDIYWQKSTAFSGAFKSNKMESNTNLGKLNLIISNGQIRGTLKQTDGKTVAIQLVKQ